jgi:hypothetical protein
VYPRAGALFRRQREIDRHVLQFDDRLLNIDQEHAVE